MSEYLKDIFVLNNLTSLISSLESKQSNIPESQWIINIIMTQWIERHIIFPKINEIKLKEQKMKEEDSIRTSIIKELKRNKSNSLYSLKENQNELVSKNLSSHKGRMHPNNIRRCKKKNSSFQSKNQMEEIDETEEQQGVKYINIVELLESRKHSFDSTPLKKMLKKLKYQQMQERNSLIKISEEHTQNGRNLKKRYIKSKLLKSKTQPQQQRMMSEQDQIEKDCLQVKKAKKFDYHEMAKEIQEQRQAKRNCFLKKKQLQRLKETNLKITSIKGWNYHYEQLMDFN